jgi:hypothetical protein
VGENRLPFTWFDVRANAFFRKKMRGNVEKFPF